MLTALNKTLDMLIPDPCPGHPTRVTKPDLTCPSYRSQKPRSHPDALHVTRLARTLILLSFLQGRCQSGPLLTTATTSIPAPASCGSHLDHRSSLPVGLSPQFSSFSRDQQSNTGEKNNKNRCHSLPRTFQLEWNSNFSSWLWPLLSCPNQIQLGTQ